MCLFPLLILADILSLNHSLEYTFLLSPVGFSSKLLNVGMALDIPDTGGNLGKCPRGEEFSRSSMTKAFNKYGENNQCLQEEWTWLVTAGLC